MQKENEELLSKIKAIQEADPITPEHVERVKSEVLKDMESIVPQYTSRASPLRRSISTDSPAPAEEIGALAPSDDIGVGQAQIKEMQDKFKNKLEKLQNILAENQKVMEAKLKKSFKDSEHKLGKNIKSVETMQGKV